MKSKYLPLFFLPLLLGLTSGEKVPDFTAKNQDGKVIRLSDFKNSPVLIYFYPKDDTPGCTKEACSLRDNFAQFKKHGAVILGVSGQDEKSHQEFKKKYQLPFDLLVDSDGSLAKKLGVGSMLGFHHRQSLLVGPDGKLMKFYSDVDPRTHSKEVLDTLDELNKLKK